MSGLPGPGPPMAAHRVEETRGQEEIESLPLLDADALGGEEAEDVFGQWSKQIESAHTVESESPSHREAEMYENRTLSEKMSKERYGKLTKLN